MKEIIQWLLKVEHTAGKAYANALKRFNDDPELKAFLETNAEDEAWHYHVMASAAEHLSKMAPETPFFTIDEQLNEKVLGKFSSLREGDSDICS